MSHVAMSLVDEVAVGGGVHYGSMSDSLASGQRREGAAEHGDLQSGEDLHTTFHRDSGMRCLCEHSSVSGVSVWATTLLSTAMPARDALQTSTSASRVSTFG